jgi:TRAP-type C4-dicarboxylate transport system permease large subunit
MSAFLIAGVTKVSPEIVFKGVIPFFFTAFVMLWLLVFFSGIATWLPNLFYT